MGNTLKRLLGIEMTIAMLLFVALGAEPHTPEIKADAATAVATQELKSVAEYTIIHGTDWEAEQEEIRNEIMYGEVEMLAQLIEAEAGNQNKTGKRYVADVVLNRVDSSRFPETIEEVIFQMEPTQFSCVTDGGYDKSAWVISQESFNVALEEYTGQRLNTEIIYFRTDHYSESGHPAFQWGDHYFSTL